MAKVKKIKTLEGFFSASDVDVIDRAAAVHSGMTGNPHFPNPPVDLDSLKKAIDSFSALRIEALDGSKKMIAEKNKQREAVVESLRLLARYVEVTSKGDMATFQSGGFEAKSRERATSQPVSEKVRRIDRGSISGQVRVWLTAIAGAGSYEVRYGAVINGALPATFTVESTKRAKPPVILDGLTPGTMYAFQARALTDEGYTDWSNPVQFICT